MGGWALLQVLRTRQYLHLADNFQRELVLDPFAGSGSSCAAALLAGRKYIGIELDAEYFHHASARLERVKERIAEKKQSSQVLIPTMW